MPVITRRRPRPAGSQAAPRPGRGAGDGPAGEPRDQRGQHDRRPAQPAGLRAGWLVAGVVAVVVAGLAGLAFGPASLPPGSVGAELLNFLPGVHIHSGLTDGQARIVTELRLPRVVLGLLVGAMLALAGGCFQGVFRNPLADPYLLGVAAGAGFGASAAIAAGGAVAGALGPSLSVPPAAFAGGLAAVALTYLLGMAGGRDRSPATLILAGVAVSAFFAACQTYLLQRDTDDARLIYDWLLGRLSTSGWYEVRLILPYAAVTAVVVLLLRRELDVLSVGDDEATSLGLHPQRSRYLLVTTASLGTAAAVAVSGLIGFVGVIVPHIVRLLAGPSYRSVLPLSLLFGAAFLALADLAARTVASPAEVPIGVLTAFLGAPFFVVVLRTTRRVDT